LRKGRKKTMDLDSEAGLADLCNPALNAVNGGVAEQAVDIRVRAWRCRVGSREEAKDGEGSLYDANELDNGRVEEGFGV
jgi:hypothetical protein